ncbi:MAG: methylated-DNA--[protein]-cysteine S-methyltransferase [Pseudomonadota bacterium]|nr:methylated-DNA--[protein]-cysteine S-methyltransferase [Pseudomonadota bacterium]
MSWWAPLDFPSGSGPLSGCGPLVAVADKAGALTHLGFPPWAPPASARLDAAPFAGLLTWLEAYAARGDAPVDFPMAPTGTEFQKRVWEALRAIPFGRTTSYGALAVTLGGATLTRAVGRANGANPIAIVVPCHRVIGADGGLVGYAGGLPNKRALLRHEGVLLL